MGEIERITYNATTFVIVGSGKGATVFLKTNLQTLKLTWFNPKEPQRILLMDIAKDIRSGDIKTVPELFTACDGKIVAVGVGDWYREYTDA